jgi:hypothetical protein
MQPGGRPIREVEANELVGLAALGRVDAADMESSFVATLATLATFWPHASPKRLCSPTSMNQADTKPNRWSVERGNTYRPATQAAGWWADVVAASDVRSVQRAPPTNASTKSTTSTCRRAYQPEVHLSPSASAELYPMRSPRRTKERKNSICVVGTPKSKRSRRTVPLPPWVAARMADYIADTHLRGATPNAPLWPSRKNGGGYRPAGQQIRHGE